MWTSGLWRTSHYLSDIAGSGVYIFRDGWVWRTHLSVTICCLPVSAGSTQMTRRVYLHTRACVGIVFLTDSWGEAASTSLTSTTLTFAAAVKVTSEHWVLLDLDRGVLNLSVLLLVKSKREGKMWGSSKDDRKSAWERINILIKNWESDLLVRITDKANDYWPTKSWTCGLWRADRLLCLFWSVKGTIPPLFSCRWNLESGWWLRKIQSFHCYLGERWWCSCPWRQKGGLSAPGHPLIPQLQ